jgi:predicted ATPase/class 3 adenylate cyclase/DNA-binding CsgD family transcriptional regulator
MAGRRPSSAPVLPTGTVTFLFTDIEGSTALWELNPPAMQRALARHDALLRDAIDRHRGQAFKSTGDGLCAVFSVAADAVLAAVAAQQRLIAEPWLEIGPLKVRMALHAGRGELQDGDYVGQPLNRLARLLATAHGGQIVASQSCADLARDSLPAEIWLRDLGEHRLRDLARPEHVYQVAAPLLPADFPPLRSLTTLPNNLPRQPTRFIGREQQLRSLRARLLREDVRLLTLTGPGGTGKTRLALQVAADLLDAFADGVYFVPLAQIVDPDLVPSAIAQALSVKESPDRPLLASLVSALRDRVLLLVIDNVEHVATAAPAVAELLAAPPRLKVLATSRSALNLYGEHEQPVPPLTLPDRRVAPAAEHATQFESVRLFVERAQAARPDFTLTDDNAAQVVEICHRLDGLPLALELAASRLRALPLAAMLGRLERRLPLLTGGPRDLPARQRTLRDTIAWSYNLLDEQEQTLFRRLAVFSGCTLDGIEAVCCGPSSQPGATTIAAAPLDLDPLDGATPLVEKSLLRQEVTEDGQPWYVMLETIREYGLERLAESAENDAIHRRYVWHYLRLAESAEPELAGPSQSVWLARLEREHDNLRAAIRWCETRGYAEPALRLALALWWFWAVHGHLGEGRQLMADVLERFRPRDPSHRHVALRARALQAAGYLAEIQGDVVTARRHHEEALRLFRGLDDGFGVESVLGALGQVAILEGNFQEAEVLIEEALHRSRERGDRLSIAATLGTLADIIHKQGNFVRARALIEEAIEVKRQVATPREIAGHVIHLSVLLEEQGEYAAARELCERTLDAHLRATDQRMFALVTARLGGLATLQGDIETARSALSESLPALEGLGDPGGVAFVLEGFAALAVVQVQPGRALRLAGAASAIRDSVAAPLSEVGLAGLDKKLQLARQALGEGAAAAAWAAGRKLTRAEAIAEALAEPAPEVVAEPEQARAGNGAPGPLSARERQVAALIARGCTNRQIAAELIITEGTVANHVVHILDRLGFNNRAQIAAWASEQGLLK